jgi:hypothetical protein
MIIIAFLSGCHANQQKAIHKLPTDKDIKEIVESIISQDSLLFNNSNSNNFGLTKLRKLRIIVPEENSHVPPPPPSPEMVYINDLFELTVENKPIFKKEDYDYLLFQNDSLPEFEFDSNISKKYIIASDKNSFDKALYSFSIPIFTSDNNFAYVQSSQYYSKQWLGTNYFILKRQNGRWDVLKHEMLFTH